MPIGHNVAKCLHCLKEWVVGDCVPSICPECEDAGHTGLGIDCPKCFQPGRKLIDAYQKEIDRLKSIIDRDRTGLANALNAVRQVAKSYGWIPAGEWGSYEWDEQTQTNFRAEVGRCFDEIDRIAIKALRESGGRANEAFRLGEV